MSNRQTQPYRATESRAPSPVLDRMRAGRKAGALARQGPLFKALQSSRQKRGKLLIPRS